MLMLKRRSTDCGLILQASVDVLVVAGGGGAGDGGGGAGGWGVIEKNLG